MSVVAHKLSHFVPIPVQQWSRKACGFLVRPTTIVRSYRRADLVPDMIAGLTVAVVLLPQAMAYALIAELPPQTGLYAAIVAAIIGALWGSSSQLHTGPTNAASLLVLATLLPIAAPHTPEYLSAAALMAVMVGVLRLALGVARLGVLANFVSDSVIVGFTAGAGILIGVNQLRTLLSLPIASSESVFVTLTQLAGRIQEAHWGSLAIGLATTFSVFLVERISRRLPALLIAMVVTSLAVAGIGPHGYGIQVVGEIPRELPPFVLPPLLDLDLYGRLSSGALAVGLIGLVEAHAIARVLATRTGQYLDSNQEFVGQGMANIATGLLSGYTCSGSFTRSAVNHAAGARTAFASVFSGLWVLVAVLLFAPLAAYLPRAALAGVLLVTAYRMIDRRQMVRIWRTSRGDTVIMAASGIAAILLPLQFAVLAGVIVSFGRFIAKTAMPAVEPVVPDEDFRHYVSQTSRQACPQLGIVAVSGSLYFGAAHHVEASIRANLDQHPEQQYLLLRMHLVDHCDVTGIMAIESIMRLYRRRGGDIFLAGVRPAVIERMRAGGFAGVLGESHFLTREQAIDHLFYHVINPSVCIYECPLRVFAECQALPKQQYTALAGVMVRSMPLVDSWLPGELWTRIGESDQETAPLLVDVREPGEYAQRHIPRALLLPLRRMANEGERLPADRPIVLVCRAGRRSRLAAHILRDIGYTQVYQLEGGMLAWEGAGYPVEVGPPA